MSVIFQQKDSPKLNTPPEKDVEFNRLLVGLLALAALAGAVLFALFGDAQNDFWCGSLMRVGLVLGAFWLALPTRGRAAAWAKISPWWIVGIAAALFFVVRNPRAWIPLAVASVSVLSVLRLLSGGPRRR
ncbi:hypothetical protein [Planctomicrobium sp. SH664]|uniref:hypothetical protein n=1 Tax=Planctomicrobium sp. SH664 TaxID=3448125 RepID=UPI003F5BF890